MISRLLLPFLLLTAPLVSAQDPAPEPPSMEKLYIENLSLEEFQETDFAGSRVLLSDQEGHRSYRVTFQADGLTQYALLSIPKGEVPQGGFPAILLLHGYIRPDKYSTLTSYQSVDAYWAPRGFVVLKPDYRGHGESESSASYSFERVAFARDALAALAGLIKVPEVKEEQLFLYGHSLGGDLALRLLTATDRFRAAAIWAPVYLPFPESLIHYDRRRADEVRRLFSDRDYPRISPQNYLDQIKTPLLLQQGTLDKVTPPAWARALKRDLEALEIPLTYREYAADHNLAQYYRTVRDEDLDFFRSHIK